ncbi:CYFA0S12e04280g1_1 [Cyberlindnera fabianii]|uniref:Ubiquitin carboxyl-terminal hydrolase n=1 Tax=Cyberlindnera fabianii TaxID=36022 RepID=A0A061B1I2_CYBFA|nr:CYFA0S12e04280g1_1 [Cyberlindnera fabianii]
MSPQIRFDAKSSVPLDKDQCFYCYRTLLSPSGLLISPSSRRAYCDDHVHLHIQKYPSDTTYVRLEKTERTKDEELSRPDKMIKLEIKEEKESDKYDLVTTPIVITNGSISQFEPSPEDTEAMKAIADAQSAAQKDDVKAWTQEYTPCEHTIEFKQSPIANVQLKHCAQCELDQNLWICLTCGQIGCGRAQFGGVPGNTHALAHYKDVGHPIAVKLGSLSKDVMDVYCYQCDEEITMPGVAGLLKTFGIDLDHFEKTEKSLVELELEQNLKWEFNMLNDEGEELPTVFGKELTGLKNLGNSCYLASVMQTLFSLPEYQQRFAQQSFSDLDETNDVRFQLVKMAKGLTSGESSIAGKDGYQTGVVPTSFKRQISEGHEEFSSMRQQDAFEFWNHVLDKVDSIDPELNDIFRFVTVDKFKFPNNEVTLKRQLNENMTLQVDIELDHVDDKGTKHYKRQEFLESLIQYFTPEEIDWEGGIKVEKSTIIQSYPKYLITAIQRIQLENWIPVKTDVPLSLPESFNISDFQIQELLEDGEVERKSDTEDDTFKPNEDALTQLMAMGFTELRATKALHGTNNGSVEEAMEWLMPRLDDPTLDDPVVLRKNTNDGDASVDAGQVSMLQDMGFSEKLATKALIVNKNNAEAAVEWLFSHPDDDGELPKVISSTAKIDELLQKDGVSPDYKLKAVVCHKGTQVTSGHYVAFIKKGDRWVLFNDEKVVDVTGDNKSWEEIERNGYVYVWERA